MDEILERITETFAKHLTPVLEQMIDARLDARLLKGNGHTPTSAPPAKRKPGRPPKANRATKAVAIPTTEPVAPTPKGELSKPQEAMLLEAIKFNKGSGGSIFHLPTQKRPNAHMRLANALEKAGMLVISNRENFQLTDKAREYFSTKA